MRTIGIIAEFNPFHNGHSYLIEKCKKDLNADFCVVVMSGDFVQRGAPAITDKFTRTKMALAGGADLVLELPIYYSTGSAEYFASGAVSILDKLGIIDYLCFGSECGDIRSLSQIADILVSEPASFKDALAKELKNGASFPKARQNALLTACPDLEKDILLTDTLSNPNNILGIEYLKALKKMNSRIKPYTIKRSGEGYHSEALNKLSSASAIREALLSGIDVTECIPGESIDILRKDVTLISTANYSSLLAYKLLSLDKDMLTKYLDVTDDLAQKITNNMTSFTTFDDFIMTLKSKDLSYSRISRSLLHILLNITADHMNAYITNDYASYARVLGLKKSSSQVLAAAHETSTIPIIDRLKDAKMLLNEAQMSLLNETLYSSKIYNLSKNGLIIDEYKIKQIIM